MATKLKPRKPTTLHEDIRDLFAGPLGARVLDALKQRFHDKRERSLDLGSLAFAEGQRSVVLLLDRYLNTPLEDLERDGNGINNDSADRDYANW